MNPVSEGNPFRPGAGQPPLYLAGRTKEQDHFKKLLRQTPITENAIITGLRGVGKTVLLKSLQQPTLDKGWIWVGNDLSESASLTEERIALRLITDLSVKLEPIFIKTQTVLPLGFGTRETLKETPMKFDDLWEIYKSTHGLVEDKLKAVFLKVQAMLAEAQIGGIVFAYDEAQNMSDNAPRDEYPLSILLDVFSFLQRQQSPVLFLLVLTGLPTLFPKLNEARTYTERMFHVMRLDRLNKDECRLAINKPIELSHSPLAFSENAITKIISMSGGYPYFIQYICKEVYDAWLGRTADGLAPSVATDQIEQKLDQDFFAARWERATDRQQHLMKVISTLPNSDDEFSAQEIVRESKTLLKSGFSPSHTTQILGALAEKGLVYRNRYGKYSFAVPLLAGFIRRQVWDPTSLRAQPA